MPPETDSSLDNGNKDKEEGNHLYSMIFLKKSLELIIEANKETSMLSLLACGSGDWAKTLCVSVFVGAGGSVHMGG